MRDPVKKIYLQTLADGTVCESLGFTANRKAAQDLTDERKAICGNVGPMLEYRFHTADAYTCPHAHTHIEEGHEVCDACGFTELIF